MELLLEDPSLDPETIQGRAFDADAQQDAAGRWVITRLEVAVKDLLDRSQD
jgi:hypothetical protein